MNLIRTLTGSIGSAFISLWRNHSGSRGQPRAREIPDSGSPDGELIQDRLEYLQSLAVDVPIRIDWTTQRNGEGERRSRVKGNGQDYCDFRDYRPGDNLRRLYWKGVAKRPDRPMVMLFEEERNASVVVVADTSDTMDGVSVGLSKRELACLLTASIMRSAARSRDVGAFLAYDHGGLTGTISPRRASSLVRLASAAVLMKGTPDGTDRASAADQWLSGGDPQSPDSTRAPEIEEQAAGNDVRGLAAALQRLPNQRSLVFVLTDMQGGLSADDKEMLRIKALKHEIIFLIVSDLREREIPSEPLLPGLPFPGIYPVSDASGRTRIIWATTRQRRQHSERFMSAQALQFAELEALNCKFAAVHTEVGFDSWRAQLGRILSGRRQGANLNEEQTGGSFDSEPLQERKQS